VALLICCSARKNAHVGDLYPVSSNSSVRFVSFRIVLISTCSWPSQHSCFFKKFHPPLVIVHSRLRPGSRHVVRPSVVMILVSSTRSLHNCDESWILTKSSAGIPWSRNQCFPITSGVSCSRRRPGVYTAMGIEGTSHCMLLRMNSEPFLSIGLLTMSGYCVELCLDGSISLLNLLCSSVSVYSRSLLQHSRFSSEIKSVIEGAK